MINKHISMTSALKIPIVLAAIFVSCSIAQAAKVKTYQPPQRILFIGNSYTAQIKDSFTYMLTNSSHKATTCEFITKGGATLKQHLANEKIKEQIRSGNWDIVVLQEQSQTPALSEESVKSFHTSVDIFSKLIRDAGAEPVLYMTWGRRDGDVKNKEVFPDYATMQQKLTEAYQSAAKRNKISLAPVGQVWALVRKHDKELGISLYKKDGSHPSAKGAYLVSCVFLHLLFQDALETIQPKDSLDSREQSIIHKAAISVDMSLNLE
jgi:hypothetical protein